MGKEKAVGPCHQSEECLTNKVASQRPVGSRVLRIRPLTDSVSVAGNRDDSPKSVPPKPQTQPQAKSLCSASNQLFLLQLFHLLVTKMEKLDPQK
jgi:hypothetical protein